MGLWFLTLPLPLQQSSGEEAACSRPVSEATRTKSLLGEFQAQLHLATHGSSARGQASALLHLIESSQPHPEMDFAPFISWRRKLSLRIEK